MEKAQEKEKLESLIKKLNLKTNQPNAKPNKGDRYPIRGENSINTLWIQVQGKKFFVSLSGNREGNEHKKIYDHIGRDYDLGNIQNDHWDLDSFNEIENIVYCYAGVKKENMEKVLFCRITSMKYYQDLDGDTQQGGGSYTEDNPAHERFNFRERDGVFKGFVESLSATKGMNLTRIDPAIDKNSDIVTDVLVIFVAKSCIVGYYKDAKVYASIKDENNYDKGEYSAYNIETQRKAVLLSQDGRNYEIPKGKGAMGQSNVFYIYDDKGNLKQDEWIQKAIDYVRINQLVKSYIPYIVDFLQANPEELNNLTQNNFGTTPYPLIKTVKEIEQNDIDIGVPAQRMHANYYTQLHNINGISYRFHSQWGGCRIWNGQNNSISLDEKHRKSFVEYLKNKEIYDQKPQILNNDTQESNVMQEIQLLKYKKQIILQGSPGTGKTRLAKEIAYYLINGEVLSNDEKERQEQLVSLKDLKQYKLIQFHPAYGYEDFVRGIVATTTDGVVSYEVQNKILAEMAENANEEYKLAKGEGRDSKEFVLIIDEINRANLSSVLGELIYALEYRGELVESMYEYQGSRKIILPENLYIIGTMNTADRSVGHIDYAIRRRFSFVNVDTDESVIPDNAKSLFNKVKELFKDNLNEEEFELNDVMIGHSYFLKKNLELALEYEIKPILQEYRKDGVLTCEKSVIPKSKNRTTHNQKPHQTSKKVTTFNLCNS